MNELEKESEILITKFGNKTYAIMHCELLIDELNTIKSKILLTVGISWVIQKINHYEKILQILKR